jgi:hypothetical protein
VDVAGISETRVQIVTDMDMDMLLDEENAYIEPSGSHFVTSIDSYGAHERPHTNRPPALAQAAPPVFAKAEIYEARPVDMSLASSYVPGIFAMLKVLVLLSVLNIMQKLGMHIDQAIIVCAACLYIDRCTSLRYILDTSACALCVLISVCVNASRIGIEGDPGALNVAVSVSWSVVSLLILCDAHQAILRQVQVAGIVHLLTSSFCAAHGFLAVDVEIDFVTYLRGVGFTILAVLWIYTLNLRERRENNDSFSSCVDRFAVVLVSDAYVSLVYAVVACLVVVWRYKLSSVPMQATTIQSPSVDVVAENTNNVRTADRRWHANDLRTEAPLEIEYPYPEDMDVHAQFRLAQQNAKKGNYSR